MRTASTAVVTIEFEPRPVLAVGMVSSQPVKAIYLADLPVQAQPMLPSTGLELSREWLCLLVPRVYPHDVLMDSSV